MVPLIRGGGVGISAGHLDAQYRVGYIQIHTSSGRSGSMDLDPVVIGVILIYYSLFSI